MRNWSKTVDGRLALELRIVGLVGKIRFNRSIVKTLSEEIVSDRLLLERLRNELRRMKRRTK